MMHEAAVAVTHIAWSSARGAPPAINWAAVIPVTIASVTIIFGIARTAAGRRTRWRPSDDDDGDFRGGGGDSPGPDVPTGPDGAPAWWPEFERQFAAHVEGLRHSSTARD
jgi:hypothetical protein